MQKTEFAPYIEGYFDYLSKIKKLKYNSLKDYRCTFRHLLKFLEDEGVVEPLYDLGLDDFTRWINKLQDEGKSPKSVAKQVSQVRGCLDYCWRTRRGTQNVLQGFYIKDAYKKVAPDVLTIEEVQCLILACPQNTLRERTERLIILFLYGLGLRTSEVRALNYSDIEIEKKQVFVKKSKNDVSRVLPVPDGVWIELMAYLAKGRRSGALFKTHHKKKRITIPDILNAVRKNTERAGIDKKVTPKTLRHSFASHLMDRGVSVAVISSLMGHKSPHETGVYLHSFNKTREDQLRNLYKTQKEEE